ncbi:MAG: hypothetical protein IJ610_07840 [Bacteroidaceae bacterium]|nr:hypothetical protein [Bacteroidaceae bacterium]
MKAIFSFRAVKYASLVYSTVEAPAPLIPVCSCRRLSDGASVTGTEDGFPENRLILAI